MLRFPQAVTHFSPGSYASRPLQTTSFSNVFMAGDWVKGVPHGANGLSQVGSPLPGSAVPWPGDEAVLPLTFQPCHRIWSVSRGMRELPSVQTLASPAGQRAAEQRWCSWRSCMQAQSPPARCEAHELASRHSD